MRVSFRASCLFVVGCLALACGDGERPCEVTRRTAAEEDRIGGLPLDAVLALVIGKREYRLVYAQPMGSSDFSADMEQAGSASVVLSKRSSDAGDSVICTDWFSIPATLKVISSDGYLADDFVGVIYWSRDGAWAASFEASLPLSDVQGSIASEWSREHAPSRGATLRVSVVLSEAVDSGSLFVQDGEASELVGSWKLQRP